MRYLIIVLLALLLCGSALATEPKPYFSSQDYLNLSYQKRAEVIASFIEHGKERGITITKGPVFYCRKLDAFYVKHPDFAKEALFTVLKTLIIMEYDWDQKVLDKDPTCATQNLRFSPDFYCSGLNYGKKMVDFPSVGCKN